MKNQFLVIFILTFSGINGVMSQWATSGNNIYNTNSGNVGIGTSTPQGLLYVSKNTTEPMVTIRNLGGYGGAAYSMIDDGSGADWKFKATLSGGFKIRDHANGLDVIVIEPNSFANAFYIKNTGSIGVGTSSPNNSALIEMTSSNKGLLPPRMTTDQRNSIQNPVDGLIIFNITIGCIDYYYSGSWRSFCGSSETSLECGSDLIDSRDGEVYNTVIIGSKCWMAENLNVGLMVNGSISQQDNDILEKYCYQDDESNCDLYGGLYQWNETMQYMTTEGVQGICPQGWHIPTDSEWCELKHSIDATVNCSYQGWSGTDIGTKMKSQTGWYLNGDGTNESDFSALPGGYRNPDGTFTMISTDGLFYSSSEIDESHVIGNKLRYNYATIGRGYWVKEGGTSIRCIKND